MTPLAHLAQSTDNTYREHSPAEHLTSVADMAERFAAPFGAGDWARLAGVWHDLGKYREGFQRYIRLANDPDAHIEGRFQDKVKDRDKTHSAAGALHAITFLSSRDPKGGALAARVLAYLTVTEVHAALEQHIDWRNDELLANGLAGTRVNRVRAEVAAQCRANASGQMATRGLYVLKHDSELGNAHTHAPFDRLKVKRDPEVESVRSFDAYLVLFDEQPSRWHQRGCRARRHAHPKVLNMDWHGRIVTTPDTLSGRPRIAGTRTGVDFVLDLLRARGRDMRVMAACAPDTDDLGVLAMARSSRRWLLTLDANFGNLIFQRGAPVPPQRPARRRTAQRALRRVHFVPPQPRRLNLAGTLVRAPLSIRHIKRGSHRTAREPAGAIRRRQRRR